MGYPPLSTDVDVSQGGRVVGQVEAESVQYGVIANWDGVKINGVLIPIVKGSLRGGTSLFVNHKKAAGSDFARYVSQGRDTLPVQFTMNLFIDYSKKPAKNWLREYEKIESLLVPRSLDRRNAISISHPSFAGKGIFQVIPTVDPILQPVDVDRWTCEFSGIDTRFLAQGLGKAATKRVNQDDISTGAVKSNTTIGPESRAKGAALKKWRPG